MATVQVGTEVSGTVQSLRADYNSVVHAGDIVATLDPSFDGSGRVFTSFGADAEWIRRLFRQADGKILAVGFAGDPIHDVVMARYWP